jgi:hypothetical protein
VNSQARTSPAGGVLPIRPDEMTILNSPVGAREQIVHSSIKPSGKLVLN